MNETATSIPVDRSARALHALLDLSKSLGSEVDLDALLAVIAEKAPPVVDAASTSVFVYDAGRAMLWSRDDQDVTPLAAEVVRTMRAANRGTALAVPILDSTENLLGVLESRARHEDSPFGAEDESLMTALASHIAVAMERARLTASFVEHERLGEALKLASEIQMRMLPAGAMAVGEDAPFEIHAYIRPARMVGGDLYDFAVERDRLYFCIGDVSGKGIGSALVMALTKTLFRANVPYYDDVARLTEAVNLRLCEDTGPTIFVTAFCGFLDLRDGKLRYCNAGHDRPFILREDGTAELLESKPGIALGVVPNFRYALQELTFRRGEALFLYTDGITEATRGDETLFSLDRLRGVLRDVGGASALRVIAGVTDAVERFVEGAPQSDDLTMMCVRYAGVKR